jgi:hypothetical protein
MEIEQANMGTLSLYLETNIAILPVSVKTMMRSMFRSNTVSTIAEAIDSIGIGERDESVELEIVEYLLVVEHLFSFNEDLGHDGHSVEWVVAVSSLSTEHDCVTLVDDCIGDVSCLGSIGKRRVDHGLKHLDGSNDWLGGQVCFLDYPLLGELRPSRGQSPFRGLLWQP